MPTHQVIRRVFSRGHLAVDNSLSLGLAIPVEHLRDELVVAQRREQYMVEVDGQHAAHALNSRRLERVCGECLGGVGIRACRQRATGECVEVTALRIVGRPTEDYWPARTRQQ